MFHFRLQSVLEVREQMARLKQKDFSEVLSRRHQLEMRIERYRGDLGRAARNLDQARQTTTTVFPMELFGNYQRRLNSEMELLGEQIREQNQDLEAKRMALVEAKRAQRTLEILRDKQRDRYKYELNRRERTTMDEIASNYHVFRRREPGG